MSSKFPQNDKRIIVTNGKSAFGNTISYSKNLNLDDEGYIKLSAPMCLISSSEDDANLDLPIDIFSYGSTTFKVITGDRLFNFSLGSLGAPSEDTGLTSPATETRVVQWKGGNWFINGDDVYDYTGASGTTVYTSRINDFLEYIELFTNRNSLVGASADNIVKQYNTSFANTTDLTIPENFTITGLAYSNNFMGVATRQSKNRGNAYFFTWDGATTSANNGYPVNDPYILDIAAYKSSWVLLTSAGELLYFNGGGFETLGTLPVYDTGDQLVDLGPNNSISFGKILDVDGDVIYLNFPSLPEISLDRKPHKPYFSAGVYCYDPANSLYHRHAPSYSEYRSENWTSSSNVLTLGEAHYLETGDEIWSNTTSGGLTEERTYYAIKLSDTTISLADTYADALANTVVSVTDTTIGLFSVKRKDYGVEAITIQGTGLVKRERAHNGFYNSGAIPFFMGAAMRPNDVTSGRVTALNTLIPAMSNRGYFVTGKYQTDSLEDMWQAVAIKYSKLSPQSSIVVKAKTTPFDPIVVGDETLYNDSYSGPSVTWDASGLVFETTADLSTAEVGDQVHIFDGAGAGQMVHIKEINLVGSTYQITVDEKVRGIISNAKSCVSIDRYKKLGTITAADTDGVKRLPLGAPAESAEILVEMRGVGVKISELSMINKTNRPLQ